MKNHELYISPYGKKKERKLEPIDYMLIIAMIIAVVVVIATQGR